MVESQEVKVAVSWTELPLVLRGSFSRNKQRDRLPQMSHEANRTHFMAQEWVERGVMKDSSPGKKEERRKSRLETCRRRYDQRQGSLHRFIYKEDIDSYKADSEIKSRLQAERE